MDILLVEDNAISRQVTAAVLAKAGYRVRTCETGRDALARPQAEPVDAVVLDVQLPDLDGPTVARQIRALAAPAGRVPIVGLTAHDDDAWFAACRAAGMDAVFAKPLQADRLAGVLSSAERAPQADRPASGELPRLDRDQLAQMVGHLTAEERRELAGLLDTRRRALAAALATYRNHGTAGELARQAHKLKGACGYLGLLAAQETARALESAAHSGGDDPAARAESLLAELPGDRERLVAALAEGPLQGAAGHNT